MPDLLLGIDAGTTSCKAAVVTTEGAEVAHGYQPTPWRSVPTGAELDPRALWEGIVAAIRQALAQAPTGRVIGIGVTSMGETGFLLDGRGEPLAPGIAWHDARGKEETAELAVHVGADYFTERTGLPLGPMWSASKYRWLRRHHSETRAGRRWLSVAEWLVRALGGEEVAELSLATRTGLLDLESRSWWEEGLRLIDMPDGVMPPLVQAGTPVGRATAIPELDGGVLTIAGHDHLSAAVGTGAIGPGVAFDSCGTAEAVVRAVAALLPAEAVKRAVASGLTVGWHVIPDEQTLVGFFKCGFAFNRFLKLLGVADSEAGLRELDEAALAVPRVTGGLRVVGIADDAATITGIGADSSPAAAWRAVLEAAAQETARILSSIDEIAGKAERLVVAGGWARSGAVRVVKREVVGDFDYPAVVEAGCRGAALFGGCAAQVFDGIHDAPVPM